MKVSCRTTGKRPSMHARTCTRPGQRLRRGRGVVVPRWCRVGAAVRRAPGVRAGCACAACRPNSTDAADGHAGPRRGQDQDGLCLGLCPGLPVQRLRSAARRGVRLAAPAGGAKYPMAFLHGWAGTLVRDEFKGFDSVVEQHSRTGAACLAHARRKFDELIKVNRSTRAQLRSRRCGASR